VYIETKRGSLYSFFDASLRGRMAGKSGLVSTKFGEKKEERKKK
jgi:hypothetical protein